MYHTVQREIDERWTSSPGRKLRFTGGTRTCMSSGRGMGTAGWRGWMKGRRSPLQLIMEGPVLLEMEVAVDYEGKPTMVKSVPLEEKWSINRKKRTRQK